MRRPLFSKSFCLLDALWRDESWANDPYTDWFDGLFDGTQLAVRFELRAMSVSGMTGAQDAPSLCALPQTKQAIVVIIPNTDSNDLLRLYWINPNLTVGVGTAQAAERRFLTVQRSHEGCCGRLPQQFVQKLHTHEFSVS